MFPVLAALALGVVGGFAELVIAKGWPDRHMLCVPAAIYVLLNGLASVIALSLANFFQLTFFGLRPDSAEVTWVRAVVAGLTGIALIRTSIGRHSDPTQSIRQLAAWFEEVMDMALAELDDRRLRAVGAPAVAGVMRRVSFERAQILLPFQLSLAHPDPQLAKRAEASVAAIRRKKIRTGSADKSKAMLLGTELATIYSEERLRASVQALGAGVRRGG
jgi:hypothetical protein